MAKSKYAGNHITAKSRIFVGRIPTGIHSALLEHAREESARTGEKVKAADVCREALARGLKQMGWEITPETAAACGL